MALPVNTFAINIFQMATIEELVSELNNLCKRVVSEKEEFRDTDKLKEVIMAIKDLGYNILTPLSENIQIDYELLSEEGKKDYDKMMDIRKLKISAVNNQEFERAADLRDVERSLDSKIRTEFSMNTDNPHFILAGKMSDIVICNNPGNLLITLIK